MSLPVYSTGTVAVAAGGTVVTLAGGMWSGINAKQGDFISIAGSTAVLITEVTDQTHLKIAPWPGAAQTAAAYQIFQNYVGRVVGVAAAEDVGVMLEKLHTSGLPFLVGIDETVPDPSYGDDGQYAYKPDTGTWWIKSGGVWTPSGPPAAQGAALQPIWSFEGDSMTDTAGAGTWPTKLKAISAFFARGTQHNFAAGGNGAQDMAGQYPIQAGAIPIIPGQEAYFFILAGLNDIYGSVLPPISGAHTYDFLYSCWSQARASGYKVVAFTLPHSIAFEDQAREAERIALNNLIVGDPTQYDYLVRLDNLMVDTPLPVSADGTHFNDLGNLMIAQEVAKTMLGVASTSAAPMVAMASENLFINGDFSVSQEWGSAFLTLSNGGLTRTADGAAASYYNAGSTVSAGRVADSSVGGGVPGLKYYHWMNTSTGLSTLVNGDYALLRHYIEGYRIAKLGWGQPGAQPLSYAFWFYSQNAGTAFVRLNNGNTSSPRCLYREFTVASGLNFIAHTVPGDTAGAWEVTNGTGLLFEIFIAGKSTPITVFNAWQANPQLQTANSTNLLANPAQVYVGGLFLSAGGQRATALNLPLLMRPYPEALRLCQRYYEKTYPAADAPGSAYSYGAGGGALSIYSYATASYPSMTWEYKVTKRAAPTLTIYSPYTGAAGKIRDQSSNADVNAAVNSGGEVNASLAVNGVTINANNFIYCHAVADARLA